VTRIPILRGWAAVAQAGPQWVYNRPTFHFHHFPSLKSKAPKLEIMRKENSIQ
jgi:hypothetical protein